MTPRLCARAEGMMEWEKTGQGADLGASRRLFVVVLDFRGLSDVRGEVSSK